jgi:uncharacterized membrane protein YwaF
MRRRWVPINLALGTNYGFIGNPPVDKSIPPAKATVRPYLSRSAMIVLM